MVFDTFEIGDKLWLIDDNFYLGGMVFNATFINISVISWRSVFFPAELFLLFIQFILNKKFVSDFRQVCGFLPVLRFLPPTDHH